MKCLVTGGAGFIGSHLVDKLINLGHDVVVIDNESSNSHLYFYWNNFATNYKLDICNYKDIRPLFNNIDYVFHLAAEATIQSSIDNPQQSIQTNILGTLNVFNCAVEAGVKRLIYASTSAVYGRSTTPNIENEVDESLSLYSLSKMFGEKLCNYYYKSFGLESIILRYFNVYGPREPYVSVIESFRQRYLLDLPLEITGDGTQKRDFIHVDDVIEANLLAMTGEIPKILFGTPFNIGYGKNYSINEVANMLSSQILYSPARPSEVHETLSDNRKSRIYLNWQQKNSLESYILSIL